MDNMDIDGLVALAKRFIALCVTGIAVWLLWKAL